MIASTVMRLCTVAFGICWQIQKSALQDIAIETILGGKIVYKALSC